MAATGTLNAAGSVTKGIAPFDTRCLFGISGTYGTAVLQIEGYDGTNWQAVAALRLADSFLETSTIAPTDNATTSWVINAGPFTQVRLRCVSIVSGTISVTIGSYNAIDPIPGAGTPLTLAGLLSSVGEIDQVADVSTRQVQATAATLAVTAALHAGRTVMLNTTHTQTVTLPQATGTGNVYTFVVQTKGTDGSKIIKVANATDIMAGISLVANTQATVTGWLTAADSDTLTMNHTTQGDFVGDKVEITDIATGVFAVRMTVSTTGNPVTPFSAGV